MYTYIKAFATYMYTSCHTMKVCVEKIGNLSHIANCVRNVLNKWKNQTFSTDLVKYYSLADWIFSIVPIVDALAEETTSDSSDSVTLWPRPFITKDHMIRERVADKLKRNEPSRRRSVNFQEAVQSAY